MNSEWTDERVVTLDSNFHLTFRDITLSINSDNRFVVKRGNQEFVGPLLLNFPNGHVTHCVLTHSSSEINLYLNAKLVLQIVNSELKFSEPTFELKFKVIQPKIIIKDLTPWVSRRQSMFKIKEQTSEQYTLVPIEKQIKKLESNIIALEELLIAIREGKKHFIDHIIASLRSLYFYKEESRNYDPLLLRIAAYKGIGLPVFVLERFKESLNVDDSFSVTQLASINPDISNNTMIDFQEYLESPIICSQGLLLSPLQFTENSATTQSIAHFDQRIPKTIASFEDTPVFVGVETFEYVATQLTQLTIQVGKYILQAKSANETNT